VAGLLWRAAPAYSRPFARPGENTCCVRLLGYVDEEVPDAFENLDAARLNIGGRPWARMS